MSDGRAAAALRQLEVLRRDYRVRTRAVLESLAMQVAERRDVALLGEVESQLHKLAGSGGSFGFAELSRQARRLELEIRSLATGHAVDWDAAALADQISALVLHLGVDNQGTQGPPLREPPKPASQGTLLLVEANAQESQRLTTTLMQFGHAVRAVGSTQEAVGEVASQPPQALLVDLDLAGDGGAGAKQVFDAINDLRDAFALNDCIVFFFSASDSMDLRLAAARAGARGFFHKPLDPMHVIDRLEMILQRSVAERFKVMLVDDDRLLSRHHAAVLEEGGFEVEVVDDPFLALERMAQFRPDLLLLDMYMPGCSGPELARVIRMHDDWLATPIVFLSAETDMALQLTAASEGADDFLTKPIHDAHLVAAVRTRCERAHQVAALINRDSLTGLLKHSRIKEELITEVGRSQRNGQPLSVAMLDIDHFKRVNDRFGHPVGDQVIRSLSNLMRQRVRGTDRVGRYGGEEFMLVLPNCDERTARPLLEDICKRFKNLVFNAEGEEFSVTLSAGLACSPPFNSAAELLGLADQALYAAKRNGRDRIEVAQGSTDPA